MLIIMYYASDLPEWRGPGEPPLNPRQRKQSPTEAAVRTRTPIPLQAARARQNNYF